MKQFDHSGFSPAEIAREPDSQTRYLRSGCRVFPSGRSFHRCGQADIGLACQALGAQEVAVRPYPSLALFSVPVIILEPIKPVAAYLAATGQIVSSVLTLIVGELFKLVLIERLFSLTRDKLMKIPAFAWAYTRFQQAKAWLDRTSFLRKL
jgi:hypothetical protein